MLVRCIDNKRNPNELTLNKKYKVIYEGFSYYTVKNDLGIEKDYNKRYFFNVEGTLFWVKLIIFIALIGIIIVSILTMIGLI